MKHLYLSACLLLAALSLSLNAQTSFFDDFESYEPGDMIAATSDTWQTWSGTPGEDAPVSDDMAFSGSNSLLITGAAGGGPVDVILPFGDTYSDGLFEFYMKMYIPEGNAAYQNIQAMDPPGSLWAMDVFFNSDGSLFVNQGSNADGFSFSDTYPQGEWFEFRVSVNLSVNIWQLFVADRLIGFFENANNSVASLDLYPISSDDATPFVYIDDIGYDWSEYEVPGLDVAVLPSALRSFYLTSDDFELNGLIKNVGTETIETVDITYDVNGETVNETLTDLNLEFLESLVIAPSEDLSLQGGANEVSISAGNINGGEDMVASNNVQNYDISAIQPMPHRMILAEELTGTWCQWCPRGAVFTEKMDADYGDHVVIVAVHGGGGGSDPMTIFDVLPDDPNDYIYSDRLSTLTQAGYPHMSIDRSVYGDPSGIEMGSLPRLADAANAQLDVTATLEGGELGITVHSKALEGGLTEDHKLAVILIENEVTGTGSGYAQSNAYAGGGSGEMGGYESLPATVPASQMVYEFVARAYLGHFEGEEGSIVAASEGEGQSFDFNYTLPGEFDQNHMKIVPVLFNADGSVNNTYSISLEDALENEVNWSGVDVENVGSSVSASVYPNPFQQNSNVRITLDKPSDVQVYVFDNTGREVANRDYGQLNGEVVLPLQASGLAAGQYIVQIVTDNGVSSQKVTINR